jgi:hypothetical protein
MPESKAEKEIECKPAKKKGRGMQIKRDRRIVSCLHDEPIEDLIDDTKDNQ